MQTNNITDLREKSNNLDILHCFADYGVESEVLTEYGDVVRVSINPCEYDHSTTISTDARHLPFDRNTQFDLGLFHPPCTQWSDMPSADTENAENLIPVARDVAEKYCDEYIIENKPRAPLQNPVTLSGKMFGIPIAYERAFETSFDIRQIPEPQSIKTEISPYFYSDRSKKWWASIKGYDPKYPKGHLAKNCIPRSYVEFLIRKYLEQDNQRDADRARSTHTDPDPIRIQSD